jgi:hypothetical protein
MKKNLLLVALLFFFSVGMVILRRIPVELIQAVGIPAGQTVRNGAIALVSTIITAGEEVQ